MVKKHLAIKAGFAGLGIAALALALALWIAYKADPLAGVPVLNAWGMENPGPVDIPSQNRTVQLVSDEGAIWLAEDEAQAEFQLLSEDGDPVGLPLWIELRRKSLGAWDVKDNAAAHYASLPVIPPVRAMPASAAEMSGAMAPSLDGVLSLAAETRARNRVSDCVLLANALAAELQRQGFATRRVSAWANQKNQYDSHTLLEVYLPELARWVLIDPTFVGYYADLKGQGLSALDAYRVTVQGIVRPDRASIQFMPLAGGVPADAETFGEYYLSPIMMFRHVAIGFGSGWAILGALDLPFTGQDEVHVPPEIAVSKGIIPPIIETRVSEAQLAWKVGRETGGLLRLTSEGGVVSDGATMNPDLIPPALLRQLTWSPGARTAGGSSPPPAVPDCSVDRREEVGIRFLRIRSGAKAARVRVELTADERLSASLRLRARTQSPGIELEYYGFVPLFDTRFPLKRGNWQVQSSPFAFAAVPRVGIILHLPPDSVVDLSRLRLLTAIREPSRHKPGGADERSVYRILIMKRNLSRWIRPWF